MKRFLLYSGIKKYSRQQVKKAKRKYFFEHHIYLLKTLKFNKIALKFHFANGSRQKFDLHCFD